MLTEIINQGRPVVAPVPALPVFVYGTLRTGQGNWAWALQGKTVSERTATLDTALMYSNGGFPFVERHPEAGTVIGEVMEIDPDQYAQVMDDLDCLEGYDPQDTNNFYDREIVTVTTLDGEQVQAYVYLVGALGRDRVRTLPVIETGDWIRYINETPRKYR